MVGKTKGNRESTDEEVIQVLKKFEKNLNETVDHLKARGTPEATIVHWFAELEIIREFLPQKLSDETVKNDIAFIMAENGLSYDQRNLGIVVPMLKAQYGDQFDGQQVSAIFKSMM